MLVPKLLGHSVMRLDTLLPTAYVVRREGYVLTRVCPSVCPHPGGYPSQVKVGGYPSQVQPGGTPTGGYPPSDLAPLHLGYPSCWTWLGGTPIQGYPTLGPPIRPVQGVPQWGCTLRPQVPPPVGPDRGGGYLTLVVLDTPRSVCLLRSRRRTFLFKILEAILRR